MRLTLRTRTPGAVALSIWLMPDGSAREVKISDAAYRAFAVANRGVGECPGRPDPAARFLMAFGGMSALDTVDGYAHPGDAWEQIDPDTGETVLMVAASDEHDWRYVGVVAEDPGRSTASKVSTLIVEAAGRWRTYRGDLPAVLRSEVDLQIPAAPVVRVLDGTIPNHRSVTFDAATGSNTAPTSNSITYAHTVTTNGDRYLAVTSWANVGSVLSSATYAGVALAERVTATVGGGGGRVVRYWDLVAPATGSNNVVLTWDSATIQVSAVQSAYGVDQTTPRSNTNTSNGSDQAPAITVTSAVDELVFSATLFRNGAGIQTCTVDADWTSDYNDANASTGLAVAHIAGAASVTRDDVLNSATTPDWAMLGVSLTAAGGGGGRIFKLAGYGGGLVGESRGLVG